MNNVECASAAWFTWTRGGTAPNHIQTSDRYDRCPVCTNERSIGTGLPTNISFMVLLMPTAGGVRQPLSDYQRRLVALKSAYLAISCKVGRCM